MRIQHLPGRPTLSTAPTRQPPKIAPAAKARLEAAKDLKAQQRQQRQQHLAAAQEHLETIAKVR
jgi:hypothetical protein